MNNVKKLLLLVLISVLLVLAACTNTTNEAPNNVPKQEEQPQPPRNEQPKESDPEDTPAEEEAPEEGTPPTALESAKTVITALERGDMSTVANWVSRDKGLRFSPYAYVDLKKDVHFSKDEVAGLMEDTTSYVWRAFPGNGELIEMPYSEYHQKFVYDADFINKGEISLNTVSGESTTLNNLNKVYPQESYAFVEYHISGIDPTVEGMDWRSLRLVFEKIGQDHALVGIIHDQWTP
ncbi:hypothetical protein [Paenibacillus sp. GCM10028914]|uniref:hypothetical protein n=1 Tax=Paenibacillus sp. GCM10028914 TaxID=3273416 RepID=UPI00361171AE